MGGEVGCRGALWLRTWEKIILLRGNRGRGAGLGIVQHRRPPFPYSARRPETQSLFLKCLATRFPGSGCIKISVLVGVFRGYKTMSGVQLQSASPALTIQGSQKNEGQ
ncbi:cytochrome c oxidase copper chaperone 1 isoform X2 [Spatholobus suberectus]|nr:cytochrome c oxidase copper chaperone 1 isoform X2 [Spatholobus suberectus]